MTDLELAHRLADIAAVVALALFGRGVGAQLKDDGSPVTEADLEVERQLLDVLARERPDDGVVSEECGEHAGCSSRRWIVDPIDWTINFAAGDPRWGTNVALEEDGEIVVGVMTRPATGERWWASRGGGAYRTGDVSLHVSTVDDVSEARISVVPADEYNDDVFALVDGRLEAVIDKTSTYKAWDYAPTVILVEEAGGRFRDGHGGRRLDLGSAVYTNGRVDAT